MIASIFLLALSAQLPYRSFSFSPVAPFCDTIKPIATTEHHFTIGDSDPLSFRRTIEGPLSPLASKNVRPKKMTLFADVKDATTATDDKKGTRENQNLPSQTKKGSFFKHDLTGDGFGMMLPVARAVDDLTGGWGLSYADLNPENVTTAAGRAFLATNVLYGVAGFALSSNGEITLGVLTEIAGAVSFWYHYSQLNFGRDRAEVRLALLTDYFTAGTALLTGLFYTATMGLEAVPLNAAIIAVASIVCLGLSWVWEYGLPYIFWHSLWHILSAWTAYLIGTAHADAFVGLDVLTNLLL